MRETQFDHRGASFRLASVMVLWTVKLLWLVAPTPRLHNAWRAPRDDWGPGIHEDGFGLLAEDDVNATTLTGRPVLATTVRKWMDHGQVGSLCLWRRGQVWGQRLVYWPDVAERATVGGNRRAS